MIFRPTISRLITTARHELDGLLDLVSPRLCTVCHCALTEHERFLCVKCLMDLQRTGYHKARHSFLETDYWGKIPVERAAGWFFFDERGQTVIHQLKYHEKPEIARYLGRLMALEISHESDFFQDIDLLVPIPLHPNRQRRRGYNQSIYLARGISQVTRLPVCTAAVIRHVDNESQTTLTRHERFENTDGIFRCIRPSALRGRHILLIDDVVTTGATTLSCAKSILQALGEYNEQGLNTAASVRFSILSLAIASATPIPMNEHRSYVKEPVPPE